MPIIDEINAWRDDIQAVFDLVPDGPSIHITCDQCWNAVVELKATEEAK
jgi:hypothetical protein